MNEMAQTRTSMTEKLEALENRVAETVQPVTQAVERVSEATACLVEDVKDTVHGVKERVEETASAVRSAFNLREHMESHPWVVFGIAATTGCMVGSFLGRRRVHSAGFQQAATNSRSKHHAKGSDGASHPTAATVSKRIPEKRQEAKPSWFREHLRHLEGLAVGALMSYVRDLAKVAVPGELGQRIAQEVDSLTTSMGAEPIHGWVFGQPPGEGSHRTQEAREFVSATEESREGDSETVNRLRSSGAGPDW